MSVGVRECHAWYGEEFPSVACLVEIVVSCVVYYDVTGLFDQLGVHGMALLFDGFGRMCIGEYIVPGDVVQFCQCW